MSPFSEPMDQLQPYFLQLRLPKVKVSYRKEKKKGMHTCTSLQNKK